MAKLEVNIPQAMGVPKDATPGPPAPVEIEIAAPVNPTPETVPTEAHPETAPLPEVVSEEVAPVKEEIKPDPPKEEGEVTGGVAGIDVKQGV